MATGVNVWSKTAASNNSADSAVNWAEGQPPSSVNDSARGMMAATAKWRDDLNGSIVTAGSSTAYTATTNQGFAALAAGLQVAFQMDETNAGTTTLAVDGLTAKPLRSAAGVELVAGALVIGAVYTATYFTSNSGEWLIHDQAGAFGAKTFTGTITAAAINGTDITASGVLSSTSTSHTLPAKGTTAQRPGSPAAGQFRFNTDTAAPETYDGSGWNTLAPTLPTPQGYLTLTSNTPLITTDVTAGTVVYYTPFIGGLAVVHNGTSLVPYQFSQLALTLTSSQAASNIYDVFLAYNAGTPVIGTGPSWASGTSGSVTAGSCARGTGAGGTALARLNGVNVNAASMSLIWNTGSGNTTITVAANQGVYLGSVFIDGSAGQVTCHTGVGQSRKWGLWNAYNQQTIALRASAPADYTSNTTTGWRAANASTANSLQTLVGLPGIAIRAARKVNMYSSSGNSSPMIGIGLNSTSSPSGTVAGNLANSTGSANVNNVSMASELLRRDRLGMDVFTALEQGQNTGTAQWLGGENFNVLSAEWLG